MTALRSALLASAAALGAVLGPAGTAHADPSIELAASPAQRCLFPAADERVKPVYPPKLYEARLGDSVTATFEFSGPDGAPGVDFDGEPRLEFREAIADYARQLRVPCMDARGGHVKLKQAFDFVPNDGRKVVWTRPYEEADRHRQELMRCIVKPDASEVHYPQEMVRQGRDAMVVARLSYFDPQQPPKYDILNDGGSHLFANAVARYVDGLRMPCLTGGPVEAIINFNFAIEGGDGSLQRRVLKDLPLPTFLAVAKPVPPNSVFFDTNGMKCPFDVRLTFLQPYRPNRVDELEEDVPARHAFLDWLGEREFNLEPKAAAKLYGQQMTLHVPCVKIDL